MHKIVIINHSRFPDYFWNHYSKRKVDPELTVEEMVEKYKGYEGELMKICFHEQEVSDLQDVLNSDPAVIRLDLLSENKVLGKKQWHNFSLLGYEYGICEGEGALYSSVFNEVLFGGVQELREFYQLLNKNLLFPDMKTAEKYVEVHQKLFEEGKDVEWPMSMKIYEVWVKTV